MLVPLILMLLECLTKIDLLWFLYYESFWGLIISTISIYASIQAAKNPAEW
jgi:hypothetical protein